MTPTAADMRELPELPTPGRVVEVRGSTWAVTDVVAQGLLRSPADESVAGRQHVVALQSLDEDRLGEELRVYLGAGSRAYAGSRSGPARRYSGRGVRRPRHPRSVR